MKFDSLLAPLRSSGLGRKLTWAFSAVLLIVALTLPAALYSFVQIKGGSEQVGSSADTLAAVARLQIAIGDMRASAPGFAYATSPSEAIKKKTKLSKALNRVTNHVNEIRKAHISENELEQWDGVREAAASANTNLVNSIETGGSPVIALRNFERVISASVQEQTNDLTTSVLTRRREAQDQINNRIRQGAVFLILVLVIALLVAGTLAVRMPRTLMLRLEQLQDAANLLARGDWTTRIGRDALANDEIDDVIAAFNMMADSLQGHEQRNQALQHQLQTNLHSEQERATRDPLTSLRNHRYFQDTLMAEIDRCARTGREVTIAVLDLDDFKLVNDRFGHHEGDAVLLRVTQGITQALRPYDLACRVGGEEFGVIFPETSGRDAKAVLDRIAEHVLNFGPKGGRATFSAGLATFPHHATTQVELYQRADEAAYTAKSRGKNQTVIYDRFEIAPMGSEERQRQQTQDAALKTARTLVDAMDQKDPYTRHHSERTALFAASIGRGLGLDDDTVQMIYRCGLLHDVGKIGISDPILRKAGRLTEDEYQQIKQHSEFSYRILETAQMEPIATWVRHHHEHWDGSGYPSGLRGEDIPLGSRIVLVADAFEAMTSDRVYRRALTIQQAVDELTSNANKQFDPTLVAVMVQLVRDEIIQQIMARYSNPEHPDTLMHAAENGQIAAQAPQILTPLPSSDRPVDSVAIFNQNPELAAALDNFHFQPFDLKLPYALPENAESYTGSYDSSGGDHLHSKQNTQPGTSTLGLPDFSGLTPPKQDDANAA